jgi:hypothetical protein
VVNGRVGVRVPLSPGWTVGAGAFTDHSPLRELGPAVGGYRVDYYGVALGVSKRTPLALLRDPSPEALVLVTTLSLRAAAGFGQARAVLLDLTDPDRVSDERARVTFWDLMPYLGSSVLF